VYVFLQWFNGKKGFAVRIEDSRRSIMRRISLLISLLGVISLFVSCSPSPEGSLIQITEGKLTFAFFFTDG
jgi:hypothetical protein